MILALPAQAEIYKWVDEKGKTHFGDRVPEKYQKKADNVEVTIRQPTQEEIAEAKNRNAELANSRMMMESSNRSTRKSKGTSRKKKQQYASDYDRKMAEYREARACFSACQVRMPKAPVKHRGPGYSYSTPGGSYLDSSACGHCKNVTRPQK
jgi:hypothetical protein